MVRQKKSVGVVIITHYAEKIIESCLKPLLLSSLNPKILVVNSSSNDKTVELAKKQGVETMIIPREEFNHGSTREKARKYLNTDIVVMMTADAYFVHPTHLQDLLQPLFSSKAVCAYARQISANPHNFLECFSRQFYYPVKSCLRNIADSKIYGGMLTFCSNACAAYCNVALDSVGGFPSVLFGEDRVVVGKLLRQGHNIAYVANSIVVHSHSYSLKQEFCRFFDTGYSVKQWKKVIFIGKCSDCKKGLEYGIALLKAAYRKSFFLCFYVILHLFFKYWGYCVGYFGNYLPLCVKQKFSSQRYYWSSKDYQRLFR